MKHEEVIADQYFTEFEDSIDGIQLPKEFTYPFFYEPHPLCRMAVEQLQRHISTQQDWEHDFGIDHFVDGVNVGKMFGVLVVQSKTGQVGFLTAFSGKLAGAHHQPGFVPPVADYLAVDSFFRRGEKKIEAVTAEIDQLQTSSEYLVCKRNHEALKDQAASELQASKQALKAAKKKRKAQRTEAETNLDKNAHETLLMELKEESLRMHYQDKDLQRHWKTRLAQAEKAWIKEVGKVRDLKAKRKQLSADLQQQLFDQYQFLNILGRTKSVCNIFENTAFKIPPAGAGDCALPKLLQYAFSHELKPLAMAEFWWGQSPSSEIRKHGYYYPSCKGKCEPILSHMLEGMRVEESPMSKVSTHDKELEIIFEDEHLLVVNKPHEFLSVPGKTNADSVLSRVEDKFPEATGPLLVHRLDRATSGLLLVAKSKEVHKDLQDQFLKRTIKKRYVALLEGSIEGEEGMIELPLRPDIEDRPRQLVCYEHGKRALTRWKVIERSGGRTLVHFWPLTGRTHQLRMHAAHSQGLNAPIVGDDLYGRSDSRLHLQAAALEFMHPVTQKKMSLELEMDFRRPGNP